MMAKAKSVVEEMSAAIEADKKVTLDTGSEWLETLTLSELIQLRDKVAARIEAVKEVETAKLREELEAKARALGTTVAELFGLSTRRIEVRGNDVRASRAGAPVTARQPQEPPEGVEVHTNPANPDQRWWQGKKGKKPNWL